MQTAVAFWLFCGQSSASLTRIIAVQKSFEKALAKIAEGGMEQHFLKLQRGIEKESLRVNSEGKLAQTRHPAALGSALTHSSITTDYSEALLEFVTPIHTSIDTLLKELTDVHHYTYQNVDDEKLWVNSMPCVVEGEEKIPIARYGASNVAKMKEAYRRGLGHRYGRLMQTIAGIHFNFSLPDAFWDQYLTFSSSEDRLNKKSAAYFSLTRNFLRHSWLPCYLFGASPAVCKSFLRGRQHTLPDHDPHSFFAPHATSLRLSGLGYSNDVQSSIDVCYNSLDEYTSTLRRAIQTPHPDYQAIEMVVDGKYQQLNPNLLQIENEFYAVIRPKQVAHSGESPSRALMDRGVAYVEIRSLDLNPYVPIGIDAECIRFFDLFLLYCLFSDDQPLSTEERLQATENRQRAVMNGREEGLTLTFDDHNVPFAEAATDILDALEPLAGMMDTLYGGSDYQTSLAAQRAKVQDSNLLPSARILAEMEHDYDSFYAFAMAKAEQHETFFKQQQLDPAILQSYRQEAAASLQRQAEVEQADSVDFPAFLEEYFKLQNA